MDPLSTAASVLAVIKVASSVAKYITSAAGATKARKKLRDEVRACQYVLQELLDESADVDGGENWKETITALEAPGSPLARLSVALHAIEAKLQPSQGRGEGVRGSLGLSHLAWPFCEKDIQQILIMIEREKSLLMLALENDSRKLLRQVDQTTKGNQKLLVDLVGLVRESSEDTDTRTLGLTNAMRRVEMSQTVLKEHLGQLQQSEQDRHAANWRRNVLEWLTPVDYVSQQSDYANQREPGTGQWLLESPQFKKWVSETEKQTLFCPGIPGAGKTILTAVAIEEVTTMFEGNSTVAIAFVYCNFRREHQQSIRDLLSSLLRQIAQSNSAHPVISDTLQVLSDRYMQKKARPSVDILSKALRAIVPVYSQVFFFVDALDECQTTDGCRAQFIAEILSLQQCCRAKLFTTSRWIPEIADRFRPEDTLTVEIRAKPQDVRKYTNSRLPRLPGFVVKSPKLQEEIRSGIEKSVDGMFLLAQLHLDSLIGKRSPKALRAALARLPSGSDAYDWAYKDAMIRIESQVSDQVEMAKQALSWITCAKRPLTTAELLHALAIEAKTSELDTDSVPQLEDIVSSCLGLVTVDEESDIVRLVHYTTQEYFERAKDEWFPNMERDLANACVTYLSYDCFGGLSSLQGRDMKEVSDKYPLYDYASCNWGHHVREAGLCTAEIVSFLSSSTGNAQSSAIVLLSEHTDRHRYWPTIPKKDDKQGLTGIHLAAYFGAKEACSAFVSHSSSVDLPDICSRTPLSWAAENGHREMVEWLLRLGANADSKDDEGQTPLSWASKRGHDEVVRLLLRAGVDPDSKSESERTPLSKAAANGHASIVKLLLNEEKVDLDSRDEDGKTPLLRAVENGHTDVVRLLCTVGADVNSLNVNDQTPLIIASRWVDDGCDASIRLLLDHGADPKARDNKGVSALPSAVHSGNLGIVKILLERGVELDTEDDFGMTPLCWAARGGQIDAINMLLHTCNESIGDKSKRRYEGYLLEWAIECSNMDMTERLLEQGVDLTVQDYQGQTALHISCRNGAIALSRRLLDLGADMEARERRGLTPLALAVSDKPVMSVHTITILLEKGADTEARDLHGYTPLALAVKRNSSKTVKLLLSKGADINSRTTTGRTPLATAIISDEEEMFELLLQMGADIDAKDNYGCTILSLAAFYCSAGNIVERIIQERPSLINVVDNEGRPPLRWAIESGSLPVVDVLLRNGAGSGKFINNQDPSGMTALLAAVRWGHVDVAKLLLQHAEIDPDLGDFYGTTPLSLAARIAPSLHCLELTKLLLETGRVTGASKDCFGRTPLWWARRARNYDVEVLLMGCDGQSNVSELSGEYFPEGIFHSERARADCYCDICYRSLKRGTDEYTSRYKCQECYGGDCDIYEECYDAGGRCLDTTGTHCLIRAPPNRYLGPLV